MSSNHQHPPSNDDSWDALLEMTPAERAQFVAADEDQALLLEVHRRYRKPVADAEFSEQLLASLVDRVADSTEGRVAVPGTSVWSQSQTMASRRAVWRKSSVWGYVTIAVIVGLLGLSAAYTFDLTGDDSKQLATEVDQTTPSIEDLDANLQVLSGVVVIPSVVASPDFALTQVTLEPGSTYLSPFEGTDIAFALNDQVVLTNEKSGLKSGENSVTSPFSATNIGDTPATFLVGSVGVVTLTSEEQVGVALEPLGAVPIAGVKSGALGSGEATVQLIQGVGTDVIPVDSIPFVGYVADDSDSAVVFSASDAGGMKIDATPGSGASTDLVPDASGTAIVESVVTSGSSPGYVSVTTDAGVFWYVVTIVSAVDPNVATPPAGFGATPVVGASSAISDVVSVGGGFATPEGGG